MDGMDAGFACEEEHMSADRHHKWLAGHSVMTLGKTKRQHLQIPARKNRFRVGLCAAHEIVAGM